jgi:hypothetical protein
MLIIPTVFVGSSKRGILVSKKAVENLIIDDKKMDVKLNPKIRCAGYFVL